MQITDIIIKPYITEKTEQLRHGLKQVITFLVNPKANKYTIRQAFKAIYNIDPEKINVVVRKPVSIKNGTRVPGYTKLQKIAYITLPKGTTIALTKEEQEEAVEQQKEMKKEAKKEAKVEKVAAPKASKEKKSKDDEVVKVTKTSKTTKTTKKEA